jgi:hypothetical protein
MRNALTPTLSHRMGEGEDRFCTVRVICRQRINCVPEKKR